MLEPSPAAGCTAAAGVANGTESSMPNVFMEWCVVLQACKLVITSAVLLLYLSLYELCYCWLLIFHVQDTKFYRYLDVVVCTGSHGHVLVIEPFIGCLPATIFITFCILHVLLKCWLQLVGIVCCLESLRTLTNKLGG